MQKSKLETLETEAGHLIRHIGHFYNVGHSKYTRPGQWAQVCYYGEAFIKAINNFLQEEQMLAILKTPAGNKPVKKPNERVTND